MHIIIYLAILECVEAGKRLRENVKVNKREMKNYYIFGTIDSK